MKLLMRPSIYGIVVTILWYLLRLPLGLNDKSDEGIMASGTIAFLFVVYALMAAFTMAKVWTEWRDIEEAVRKKDESKFVDLKDQRIPGTLKMLLKVFSIFIVLAFFITGFESVIKGAFSILSVTFMLGAVWEVLMDLDDYFTGEWIISIESLPEEWQEKYFPNYKKDKK